LDEVTEHHLINMNSYKILSVVLFFAATVFFAVSSAAPSPQLLNCGSDASTLCQGLPLIRDALVFNRNGPDAVSNGNANRGGLGISLIDGLVGQ